MSGNDEKIVITPEKTTRPILVCPECGEHEWYCSENVIHYYDMCQDEDGRIWMSSNNDYGYTGSYNGWWCNDCGREAPPDMAVILSELRNEADWN